MTLALYTLFAVGLLPLVWMRGQAFHNLLVARSACALEAAGFTTRLECPKRLPDGQVDFIDVYAMRGAFSVAIEVETTARYVGTNVAKARQLGLPLWIIVPNRRVRTAVMRRLGWSGREELGSDRILLLPELEQGLTPGGALISAANGAEKSENKNRRRRP